VAAWDGGFSVLDRSLSTVRSFTSAGALLARFGRRGDPKDAEALRNTVAVSAARGGKAGAVAGGLPDAAQKKTATAGVPRVAVALRERRFGIHLFGPEGAAALAFPQDVDALRDPVDVALAEDGTVHVLTRGALVSFGPDGSPKGLVELAGADARAVACAPDGRVYVLDARAGRLAELVPTDGGGSSGSMMATGREAELPRHARAPQDVACDRYGRTYVLDAKLKTLFVWRTSGAP
jgi:hypothetical protein